MHFIRQHFFVNMKITRMVICEDANQSFSVYVHNAVSICLLCGMFVDLEIILLRRKLTVFIYSRER